MQNVMIAEYSFNNLSQGERACGLLLFENMKLNIEIVPRSSWYSNVRSNVSSQEWDKLRKACYKKADYTCEICGGRGDKRPVECHEVWDYDEEKNIQKLIGLIALCPNCHQVKHIGFASINGNFEISKKHLMKVDNISEKEADELIKNAFKIWEKRSLKEWKIDIDYINEII